MRKYKQLAANSKQLTAISGLPRRNALATRARSTREQLSLYGGQSLFELVVALGVMSLILLSLVSLATISVRNSSFSRNSAEATRLGQEAIEWLRLERDKNWDTMVTNIVSKGTTTCMLGLSWTQVEPGACDANSDDVISGIFKRDVAFATSDLRSCTNPTNPPPCDNDVTPETIDVAIRITWQDTQGVHEVRNSTTFTDSRVQ